MKTETWMHYSNENAKVVIADGKIVESTFIHAPVGSPITKARKDLRAFGWKIRRPGDWTGDEQ